MLTAAQLATELSCSLDTVYAHARSGNLPYSKLGSQYRFDLDKVTAALEAPKPAWHQSRRSTSRRRVA